MVGNSWSYALLKCVMIARRVTSTYGSHHLHDSIPTSLLRSKLDPVHCCIITPSKYIPPDSPGLRLSHMSRSSRRATWLLLALYLLQNICVAKFAGWIDPDTVEKDKTRVSYTDGKVYQLVMSDEFNKNGRKFKDGEDPMWTGIDKSDDDQTSQGRKSLQFYNSSNVYTNGGHLIIETNTKDTKWKGWNPYEKKYEQMSRHFKSGMIQSWDKFCFTGGILEVDVTFPGRSDIGGLWPAVWLMGNLGRATYEASTNLMWPWSYEKCDRNMQRAQEISGCDITSHYELKPGMGRGATEIDIIEIMPGPSGKLPIVKNGVQRPYTSMTLQVAPGIPASMKRPPSGTLPEWGFHWYPNLTYGANTSINPFFYGTYLAATKTEEPIYRSEKESYQCDAISSMMTIDKSYFEKMHTFRFEWQPGPKGYVHWYVDNKFRFGVEQRSLDALGLGSKIPNEPSYVIMNTAISTSWGFPAPPYGCTEYDCKTVEGKCGFNPGFCQTLPAFFHIDYVRIYQNKNDSSQTLGCNTKEYPTKKFIQAHAYRYKTLLDPHPLKEVKVGGGACKVDDDCGAHGHCYHEKCKCDEDWVGSTCLSPNYHNDFSDWDVEGWLILDAPHIPKFLFFCFIILVIALIGAAIIVKKRVIQPTPPVSFSTPMANERVPIFASKKPAWL